MCDLPGNIGIGRVGSCRSWRARGGGWRLGGDLETVPRGFVIRALDLRTGNPALLRTKWRQEIHVDK